MGKKIAKWGSVVIGLYLLAQVVGAAIGAFVAVYYGDETMALVTKLMEKF